MENLTVTRKEEVASDFGLRCFTNGAASQVTYTVILGGKILKQSTFLGKNEIRYAYVIFGLKAKEGIVIEPNEEIIYDVKFSTSNKKKFANTSGTRQIILNQQ